MRSRWRYIINSAAPRCCDESWDRYYYRFNLLRIRCICIISVSDGSSERLSRKKNPKYRKKVFRRQERKRESLFRTREAFRARGQCGRFHDGFAATSRRTVASILRDFSGCTDARRIFVANEGIPWSDTRHATGVRAVPFLRRRMFCIIAQSRY